MHSDKPAKPLYRASWGKEAIASRTVCKADLRLAFLSTCVLETPTPLGREASGPWVAPASAWAATGSLSSP
eukprot:9675663-Heterocapsa_arctica.AAC.1